MFDASYNELLNTTGCIQKCSYIKYEIVKVNEQKITWNTTKWLSEFYVYTDSDNLEERYALLQYKLVKNIIVGTFRTQYYSYDIRDLIGAVGGYFGLFLGWSFLSMFAWCLETVPNMRNNIKTIKKGVSII